MQCIAVCFYLGLKKNLGLAPMALKMHVFSACINNMLQSTFLLVYFGLIGSNFHSCVRILNLLFYSNDKFLANKENWKELFIDLTKVLKICVTD